MQIKKLIVIAMLAVVPSIASAKRCKKGQPCGNSCISWSKTCHIPTYREADGNTTRTPPSKDAKPIDQKAERKPEKGK